MITKDMRPDREENWLRTFRYSPNAIRFSPRQWLIAQLVACGLSDKEIASIVGVAVSTVKVHISGILRLIGVWRRAQLVRFMLESGEFNPEEAELALQSIKAIRLNCPNVVRVSRDHKVVAL